MKNWKYSVAAAAVLLALSLPGPASANPGVVMGLVDSMLLAQAVRTGEKEKPGKPKSEAKKAQGYEKSGNPNAAGGPQNPGKKKPQKPSDVRPEQPIEKPKPEQPIEGAKPEQPIAPPKPEPRDKDNND